MTKHSNVIDTLLADIHWVGTIPYKPHAHDDPCVIKAKKILATELVRMLEETLPEKCMGAQLNIAVQSTSFPTVSAKELVKNRQLQGEGWDMAINETRTRLTAIIERELG